MKSFARLLPTFTIDFNVNRERLFQSLHIYLFHEIDSKINEC